MSHPIRRSVPSLTALVAFEAAGRRESFTQAAAELGVSQAAVSRQIAALEADLGLALFERANRRVRLTVGGKALHDAVKGGFDGIADTIAELRTTHIDLTVSVSVAFAHFRLLPILSSFRATAPQIGVRVISEDDWRAPLDRTIDMAIRYGRPPFDGMTIVGSLKETIVPVCAPEIASRLKGVSIDELIRQAEVALIESEAPEPSWLNWSQWLSQIGAAKHVVRAGLNFTSYSDAAYAAMAGQGVMLGWTGLLERPLADGRLVELDLPRLVPEERQYAVVPKRGRPSHAVDAFVRWFSEDAFR
ncbi:transcriptional regulator, LysR family [Pseudooceanicola nitratireducens]|mgnify:FL=1|uniref:Transcriptional regulator, LysR family n=1 Tax=Pseudooceanicola nitratireducens TaxID=517719 RepID=A0A1I1MXQ7_9RHOB|nr:LysR substrate-binding domain-containing protein [Pseudooceanicola nitratireducens]SEI78368.1 DNA-binding transcriptional regulator, LysR family [Pseudooceanicola nitratireducens]SFC90234.1 transcriptional regulator, LysR family [Pseudooceanicola nitratireducens]